MSKPNEKRAPQKYAQRKNKPVSTKSKEDPSELVTLTHGKNTNFQKWKEKMRNKVALEYGELMANIIDNGELLLPPEVDPAEYRLRIRAPVVEELDENEDEQTVAEKTEQEKKEDEAERKMLEEVEWQKLKLALTARQNQLTKIDEMLPKVAALMWMYLSRESLEAVRRHEDFDEVEHRNDPVQLYLSIVATHQSGSGGTVRWTRPPGAHQQDKCTAPLDKGQWRALQSTRSDSHSTRRLMMQLEM